MTKIELAVREFAQPNSRHGHIDMFSGFRPELATGSEIHRIIQEKDSLSVQGYEKEVCLKGCFTVQGFEFALSGRIDGLIRADGAAIIEEIKSTSSIDRLKQALSAYDTHPYLLQVRTYGYLFYLETGVVAACRLRLVSSLTQKEEQFQVLFDVGEFERWRDERADFLIKEKTRVRERIQQRIAVAKAMRFPFDRLRTSQEDLLAAVDIAVREKKHLLVQAPTGLGKTAGVSFPALKDAMTRGKQLVYVTPKNSQHKLAEEVVERLRTQGVPVQSLLLTAKSKICMQDEPICTPEHCEYSRNYYDKLSEHRVLERLRDSQTVNAEVLKQFANDYKVCPFELGLEMTTEADVVVGDYNYVFSPRAAIMRLQVNDAEENLNNNLVIDEAHNLPQRLCDYLSPEIKRSYFVKLKEREDEFPEEFRGRWRKLLTQCLKVLNSHEPASLGAQQRALIQVEWDLFYDVERRINAFLISYFEAKEKIEAKDPAVLLQRYWGDFTFVALYEGAPFFASYRNDAEDASIKITCCDASSLAREAMSRFGSVVGFSATYKPFEYFAKLSGFNDEKLKTAEFSSPFPRAHRKVLVIPQVSTRFRDRERSFAKIGEAVKRIVSVRKGNYFIFFPSYEFLQKASHFIHVDGFRVLKQEPHMKQKDAEDIIAALKEQSRGVLVLAVQGGVFAEGVDYPGDVLIGAFIIGPGLPVFEFEREQLRKYYDERFGFGFEFAYVYPGMTRVIQAAGRVIRTEEDRGLIVLIDDRFLDPMYAGTLPSDWYEKAPQELASQSILRDVATFWTQSDDV